ncbi:MAG TPA: hypothetical protein VG942_10480 [Hyphomonadaceae bacterium]|nr:hypothetical protein [Hyphomonadaceae bacterium]
MLTYSTRRNMFEKGQTEWRLDGDTFIVRDHKGQETRESLANVTTVRLAFTPTQYQEWRHVMVLGFKDGKKKTVENSNFVGVGSFENRSATYTPFVMAVVDKVKQLSPKAVARTGAGPIFYWTTISILSVAFLMAAVILAIAPMEDISGSVFIKLGILAVTLPVLILWARKSYPRSAELADLSAEALPPAA